MARFRSQNRDLAHRQAQAATSFRDAVRHSIAVDTGDSANDGSVTSSSPSGIEAVPTIPAEKVEPNREVYVHPVEDTVTHGDQGRQKQDEHEQNDTRRWKGYNEDDSISKLLGNGKQTAIDYVAGDDLVDAVICTGRAACFLASELSRLAARQEADAGELLQVSSSEAAPRAVMLDPRKDPRKDPGVLNALAALGQAVGLQAKAVGLMEEIVVRTAHSRVSGREE